MLDCVPKVLVLVVVALLGTKDESVLTGTGISRPEAIIAFLLLVVKTTGRLRTLNRPVESSALTIAPRPSRALLKKTVVPLEATPATFVRLNKLAGSNAPPPALRETPATMLSPWV